MASIDHRANYASRKIHAPENFVWYAWEVIDRESGDCLLTGCTSSGVRERGKNKGQPKYDGTPRRVVVTQMELDAERARFEQAGKCWNCGGDGQEFASWRAGLGTTWRECRRCKGSGLPPSSDAVDPQVPPRESRPRATEDRDSSSMSALGAPQP